MADKSNTLARNKKAYHDYEVLEKLEAGIVLQGTEVKSIRAGDVNLQDSYAQFHDNEIFMHNCHISPYKHGNIQNHEPKRQRKLLLNKVELRKLKQQTDQKGATLVPLALYLKHGRIKVSLGICRGKTHGDKRQTLKDKEANREMQRAMRNRNR